jgi:hypothetical protein
LTAKLAKNPNAVGGARMTRRSMTAESKNSGVEGEHEKRDDKAHAGQCNYDLDHAGSIDRNFLMPGERCERRRTARPQAS